ncbi:hypothetical protein JQK62_19630, partial [Leptospira santarosai]|nr:hypothetical protein [Leptospira santarosai]
MIHYQNLIKYIALQKYCISKGYGYLIAENYYSINKLIHHKINNNHLEMLKNLMRHNSVKWLEAKRFINEFSLTQLELNALVLHGNLKLTTVPYTISKLDNEFQEFISLHKEMTEIPLSNDEEIDINKEKNNINNLAKGRPLNGYLRWTLAEDNLLMTRFSEGMTIIELSHIHGRAEKSIKS